MSFYFNLPKRSPSKQSRTSVDMAGVVAAGRSPLSIHNTNSDSALLNFSGHGSGHSSGSGNGSPGLRARSPRVNGRRKLMALNGSSDEDEKVLEKSSNHEGSEASAEDFVSELPQLNIPQKEPLASTAPISSGGSMRSFGSFSMSGRDRRVSGRGPGMNKHHQSRREVLGAGKTIFSNIHAKDQIEAMKMQKKAKKESSWADVFIVFPMGNRYRAWWMFTVVATCFTFFFETYQIAFPPAGLLPPSEPSSVLDYTLITIFAVDMVVHFNLAYFNEENQLIYSHREIAKRYLSFYFWIDLVGVMPFYLIALAISGQYLENNTATQYMALLRLFRLVRMRRVKQLFDIIKFSTKVSLMSLTLIRNGVAAMVWSHFAACVFYFIAKQYDFDADNTWIGPHEDMSPFQTYVTTLYWSVVTFTTVGYGDYSPVNPAEQIFGMIFMLLNIILMAYIIGSITLLVVKNDEATGMYRDNLHTLFQYCSANDLLDDPLYKRLKTQLKVEFNHRDVGDEMVLQKFPKTMRQKVLYRLYSPILEGTNLLKGIRQHFVTDFLAACRIVIFSSGEELLARGAVSSDLFLLVDGEVELSSPEMKRPSTIKKLSFAGSDREGIIKRKTRNKDFINEVSFFTESPQIDTVRTTTVCKTLIISKTEYKTIADDHPGSVGRLLHNLLQKVTVIKEQQEMKNAEGGSMLLPNLPKSIAVLAAGSEFDRSTTRSGSNDDDDDPVFQSLTAAQTEAALSSVQDLVEMHINKQKDDHTTRFLFAAHRDDVATIRLMCDQGFNPDSSDYDCRTALMVASMKGNTDTVEKLLEYGANPHLKDHHGICALLEALENGHDLVVDILLNERTHPDMHWLDEARASALMNQAVFEGNIRMLARLIKAGVDVDAGDYDMRRPVHIAASEGNMNAFRVLVQAGADLTVRDRWNNTVLDDAKRSKHGKLVEFIRNQDLFKAAAGSDLPNLDEDIDDDEKPMES
eukprot:scaffold7970_cov118-Cylindrotheca_fusiformis.AAC.13